MFRDPLIRRLTAFVQSIGIDVIPASSLSPCRFPGLDIQHGRVLVDETRVLHPGNILHEAGHIAVTHPSKRGEFRLTPTDGEEISTLAWSYAAALHLDLEPETVFYPGSYQNSDQALIENFAEGRYIGVPLLQLWGMSCEPAKAAERGMKPFPHMARWMR